LLLSLSCLQKYPITTELKEWKEKDFIRKHTTGYGRVNTEVSFEKEVTHIARLLAKTGWEVA
jgi:hypothetical protein